MNQQQLLDLAKKYFLITGIIAHVVVVVWVLLAPEIIGKTQLKVQKKLRKEAPIVANTVYGKQKVYSVKADLAAAIPKWQPLKHVELAPDANVLYSENFENLQQAVDALKRGDTLLIKEGVYQQAVVVQISHVKIIGVGHVVFEKKIAKGKAAFVTKGSNIEIRNIECRQMRARAQNGACVRHEGSKLFLNHVYFHDSENGILSGTKKSDIAIRDSWFVRLGKAGRSHGIYASGKSLTIHDSYIIASKDQGHEVKSRAKRTVIENSVIATLSAKDSRLIDISNGGELIIKASILQQGPKSVNQVAIGYGLEGMRNRNNRIEMTDNIIILEREGVNKLFHLKDPHVDIYSQNNLVVSPRKVKLPGSNLFFNSREEANLPDYPMLPIQLSNK